LSITSKVGILWFLNVLVIRVDFFVDSSKKQDDTSIKYFIDNILYKNFGGVFI